jgi:hypothetical protein
MYKYKHTYDTFDVSENAIKQRTAVLLFKDYKAAMMWQCEVTYLHLFEDEIMGTAWNLEFGEQCLPGGKAEQETGCDCTRSLKRTGQVPMWNLGSAVARTRWRSSSRLN